MSEPFSAAAGALGGANWTTTTYDELSRPLTVTNAAGGSTAFAYTANDTLITVAGSPSIVKQEQFDALGRLQSVCAVTGSSADGTCSQTGGGFGYFTRYSRNGRGQIVQVNQGSEQRSFAFDELGRLVQAVNPESGTTNYYYGSAPDCAAQTGTLAERRDAAGNDTCYAHDSLDRVTEISYPTVATGFVATPARHFVYDAATVDGVAMPEAAGRLAEAYTGTSTAKITDEGFGYTALGQPSDFYELNPATGVWMHSAATYIAGSPASLSLPGVPTLTYTLDGEGRVNSISAATGQAPLTRAIFDAAGRPTTVTLGNGASNSYTYASTTGLMSQYKFQVAGGATDTGTLTWNANGSLGALAIADNVPNGPDSQSCTFQHDPLGRLSQANCGTLFTQSFSFDGMGNLKKTGTGENWNPVYDDTTNRAEGVSYDADGNPTNDGLNTYTWRADGSPAAIGATSFTTDALGREIEANYSWGNLVTAFTPSGAKAAIMNGGTLDHAYVSLPGGSVAMYNASGLTGYREAGWLGSDRLSTDPSGNATAALAYGPYGETYAAWGSGAGFTGQYEDTVWSTPGDLYEFPARRYSPTKGRWLTPDPAGLAAVNPANPQSWNEYAYANNNPLSLIDPLGLDPCPAVSKNSNPKSKDDEDSGEFGPYEPQGGSEAEEQQAAANGNCTSLDGVDLPSGLFGDLGGFGGGWGGGGSMGASPLVSSGGQSYQVVPNPYGGYCYQGQVGQYICNASSYQGELGLADPNLLEEQISNLNATLTRSSTPTTANSPSDNGTGSLVQLGRTVTTFAKLTEPFEFAAANTAMIFTGTAIAGFGLTVAAAGCLDPTPFELVTCGAGVAAGGFLVGTGLGDIGLGAYFFEKETLPAFENWGRP